MNKQWITNRRNYEKISVCLMVVVLFLSLTIPAFAYSNPIRLADGSGNELPAGDPFVMKYNGTYYCYVSGGNCFRSTDLVK